MKDIVTGQVIPATSEREIFEILGLNYIKPEFRNCWQNAKRNKTGVPMPHYDSSDDEPAPVFVFDEGSFGIRRRDPATVNLKKAKPGSIDLDTSEVVDASKKANMDADE